MVVVMQRMQKYWTVRVAAFHVAVAALTALSLTLVIATQAPAGPVSLVRGSLGRRRVDVRPTTATPTIEAAGAPPYEQETVWL
jgi:hypothetical protein